MLKKCVTIFLYLIDQTVNQNVNIMNSINTLWLQLTVNLLFMFMINDLKVLFTKCQKIVKMALTCS